MAIQPQTADEPFGGWKPPEVLAMERMEAARDYALESEFLKRDQHTITFFKLKGVLVREDGVELDYSENPLRWLKLREAYLISTFFERCTPEEIDRAFAITSSPTRNS